MLMQKNGHFLIYRRTCQSYRKHHKRHYFILIIRILQPIPVLKEKNKAKEKVPNKI